jgi:alanyl-tRNA synthetase
MTHRLYYYDATCRTFTARVIAQQQMDGGDGVLRPAVCLDQTAFYPTSGGQPHDTGALGGISVIDVQETEDGKIWHFLDYPLPADVQEVSGEIDWNRRFDHMQQHSGQHLLSAAFEDLMGGHTIGFHLGRESSTIDLDLGSLAWEAAFRVEQQVNEVIWQNRSFTMEIMISDDAADLLLRKPPAVTGDVRVIRVESFDACACGGTHVSAAGEIGLVKVTGVENYKGGVRVHFLCGRRALTDYQQTLRMLQTASLALSVGPAELVEAIERLGDEAKESRRELRKAQGELTGYEAERLWRESAEIDGKHVVVRHWIDRSFAEARALAAQLRVQPNTLVLLAVTEPKGVRLVCSRSDDLPGVDASRVLREVAGALGGRGGGQPTLAQGGTPLHPREVVVAALAQARAALGCGDPQHTADIRG